MHCTTCVATNCHYVRTDAYMSALRSALEGGSLWANNLGKMQVLAQAKGLDVKKAESRKGRLRAWYALGKEVGLTAKLPLAPATTSTTGAGGVGKAKVREGVAGCWWAQCERRGKSDEEIVPMFSRCSRCKTARYCSADCQKADWAMHKSECKTLKGGA